jgi:isoamylase
VRERTFLQQGSPFPMGAHCLADGVNFAVFSQHATRVELCIFSRDGVTELDRKTLFASSDPSFAHVFHGFLPKATAGLVYGYRVWGPHCPEEGHCFMPERVLLDPYAREVLGMDRQSSSNPQHFFLARVTAPHATAKPLAPPLRAHRVQASRRVLYEVHVKGFTAQQPLIPKALRGTYSGLAHPESIRYFKQLGITTLSLLPVQASLDEWEIRQRGLVNYWGYNTLAFFFPNPRLAVQRSSPSAVNQEFRDMVKTLQQVGLEVVLDVVYNHTAEAGLSLNAEDQKCFSFRGFDNASWYRGIRLPHDGRWRDHNVSGCGNALNFAHPKVREFVLDSMRYWVNDMGVDGFRFDLAPIHGREEIDFSPNAPFFQELQNDPNLRDAILIAEPWDAGHNGYHLGKFPNRWLEWNDRYRDAVRGFWIPKGKTTRGQLASALCASSVVFEQAGKTPLASVNFITAHDGFTLRDLLSYNTKHNLANGEQNRDGRDHELCDALSDIEGPSTNPSLERRRATRARSLIATLLLSQGTPMLCAGDEIGRTQFGNNNAYCQDNEINWLDWQRADQSMLQWVQTVLKVRSQLAVLRSELWFTDPALIGHFQDPVAPRIYWFNAKGSTLTIEDWHARDERTLCAVFVAGTAEPAEVSRTCLVLNGEQLIQKFILPKNRDGYVWSLLLNSEAESGHEPHFEMGAIREHPTVRCGASSLLLFVESEQS